MNDFSDVQRLLELIQAGLTPGEEAQIPDGVIAGTFGRDVIRIVTPTGLVFALNGDDLVFGNAAADYVAAGEGDDVVRGLGGDDILLGGTGNDTIFGGEGRATLEGGAGDDRLLAGDLADLIRGNAGDDTVSAFAGSDRVFGGDGNDVIGGADGNDKLLAGRGDDHLVGGRGNDLLVGADGNDSLVGQDGRDRIGGGNGDDTVMAGAGDDTVNAGGEDDFVDAGDGDDAVFGGEGDDTVVAGLGNDTVDGGAGVDTLTLAGLVSDYRYTIAAGGAVVITALDGSAITTARNVETFVDADGSAFDPTQTVTFQLLHASDFEGNTDAAVTGTGQTVSKAAAFATIVDFLEDQYATTLTLSTGDNFIPSPFSFAQSANAPAAAQQAIEAALNSVLSELTGNTYGNLQTDTFRADIAILNAIGVDASVIGNHDFDLNQQGLLTAFAEVLNGPGTADDSWVGALFPYLSANLSFEPESILNPFRDADGIQLGEDSTGLIAPYTLLETNGETFGYIGVTTQILQSISSTFGDPNNPNDDVTTGTANDVAALAAIIQPIVDELEAQGVNKIILGSHLQQIQFEQELATLLSGVDIMIGGGSDTIFADATDRLKGSDVAAEDYPQQLTNADGETVMLVNTDGQYNYVGRLVVDFDAGGNIIAGSVDPDVSGVYVTDDVGVTSVTGASTATEAVNASQRGSWVKEITDAISAAIQATSGSNFFADQDVALNGERAFVRSQETNLGAITADANLWYSNELADEPVLVSIKNGGGIRASILDDDGRISELDIATALSFNNALSLITVTTDQLLQVLNHAVAASTYNADGSALATPGQFGQVGGVRFSFDPDLAVGARVQDVFLTNEAGTEVKIFEDGEATAAAADFASGIRVVTLSFLLSGGDSYPFSGFITENPAFANVENLFDDTNTAVGEAQFTNVGTEQDAFAEYLAEFFGVDADPSNNVDIPDTSIVDDQRIINLNFSNTPDTDL